MAIATRCVLAAAFALAPIAATCAASLTFSDGICEYRVAYDRKKVDGARLKATFDFLNDGTAPVEAGPSLSTAKDIAAIDIAAYRARCAIHRTKLEALRLIDVPGLEDLRKREVGELDEWCRVAEATLSGAKGDLGPMRAQAPACMRYADLLALPQDQLKKRWNDLVIDLCQASTEVNICAGQLQRDGEGPGSEARRRIAAVKRWAECAVARNPDAASQPDSSGDREKHRLNDLLARRFKAKTLSCAQ